MNRVTIVLLTFDHFSLRNKPIENFFKLYGYIKSTSILNCCLDVYIVVFDSYYITPKNNGDNASGIIIVCNSNI